MSHNPRKKHYRRHFDKKQGFKFNTRTSQGPKEYKHKNQLSETDVGITEFISRLDGFSGIIKARFSDFQVNEIDLEGRVAKLTDLANPPEFAKKAEDNKPADLSQSCLKQISQEKWDEIRAMMEAAEPQVVTLDAEELSKEERAEIHKRLKEAFGTKICANTKTVDSKKIMEIKKQYGNVQNTRAQWPENLGEYVHFLLYKESLDTLDACFKICDHLKLHASSFNYAGVKDKRAKTTQWVSVRRVEPWKLLFKTKPLRGIRIGNVVFKEAPLKLGMLSGNRFRIALRNVIGDNGVIEESLKSLQEKGFINYYGLQRFGNDKETPTFEVGKQLLLGNWKEACEIILKATESDDPTLDVTQAKKTYRETGSAAQALKKFDGGRNKGIEYLLLKGLSQGHENDFVNALESIPRNTRLLYIHSFQSLVWNLAASKRFQEHGLEVVPGDLILQDDSVEDAEDDNEDSPSDKKSKVKALSGEECKNYTIYDIVLPLPGYDVEYPENLREFYKETLEKFGLSLEMPKQKVQTYTLSGNYRKFLQRVKDLSWKIMGYNNPNDNLIRSDWEELRNHPEPQDVADAKYKALILEFSLNSSSYATMVLREILKTDTSSSSHAKLNNYHTPEVKDSEKIDESDLPNEKIGLLGDSAKYEAFKNFVFSDSSESKRKLEDEEEQGNAKIAKTEDVDG